MNYPRLRKIKKLYFGYEEISRALNINPDSARVVANRYVKKDILIRIKRNLYILREKWDNIDEEERFTLANIIQVPSYISLMTALGYYGISTQIQRGFIESIGIYRTKEVRVAEEVFNYTRIKKKLYFGFSKTRGFFIAFPEKAFLDALYLMSLKRYKFDLTSLDIDKLDMGKIKKMVKRFPVKTKKLLEQI